MRRPGSVLGEEPQRWDTYYTSKNIAISSHILVPHWHNRPWKVYSLKNFPIVAPSGFFLLWSRTASTSVLNGTFLLFFFSERRYFHLTPKFPEIEVHSVSPSTVMIHIFTSFRIVRPSFEEEGLMLLYFSLTSAPTLWVQRDHKIS